MSCISSNFSSFFLNSLNDPSEFSKYLSNGELRFSSTFEDFPVYGQNNTQQQQQQPHFQQHHLNGGVGVLVNTNGELISSNGEEGNSNIENTQPIATSVQHYGSYQAQQQQQLHHHGINQQQHQHPHQSRWPLPHQQTNHPQHNLPHNSSSSAASSANVSGVPSASGAQHFDGSFEFMKYLRHSNDYNENSHDATGQQNATSSAHATAVGTKSEASLNNGLMDLDSAHKRATARKTPVLSSANSNHHNPTTSSNSHPTPMDIYDHDSKHNIYDLHHMNSVHSSNSNESSMELSSSMTYPNSHLNASNSNTSSEGGNTQTHSDFSMLSGVANSQNSSSANAASTGATPSASAAAASPSAPKPLASFTIKDNFEAHPSHKVEEGIFQHMNKLPPKKKDNLKQLGVRFTGQMTLNDKSIIVENFIKFCQEYEIKDHRPFLSLNQSGLNKPDQIKFARYLGQGLPTFTLFCIYSNFKNLFCTKRTEIYTKDGYNLPYILDKIKCFLANTTAGNNNNNASNSNLSCTSTTTTTKDSCSNTNSINSNTTPNTTAVNANNCNNNAATAALVAMQNGSSNSNSSSSNFNSAANDNVKVNNNSNNNSNSNSNNNNSSSSSSSFTNDIINTPAKQIHNVPSPTTPRTPQIQHQQTPQAPIPTQNTPLQAHPPPSPLPTHTTAHIIANHTTTPQQTHLHTHHPHLHTHLHHHHQQQQQLQLHQQQHQQLQLQQHPHVQMPLSPMVVVTSAASVAVAPSAIMASNLPLTAVPVAATATQSTTNHNQHSPHHMQPNNHLPLHHHPHHHHPAAHSVVTQPSIQHHATAVVYQQQQPQPQPQPQQHNHHQQLQNNHPLHNLAAQNPPL